MMSMTQSASSKDAIEKELPVMHWKINKTYWQRHIQAFTSLSETQNMALLSTKGPVHSTTETSCANVKEKKIGGQAVALQFQVVTSGWRV